MIQRIQSVFLFLVAAIMVTVLFLPIWNKLDLDAQEKVTLNAFKMVYSSYDEAGEPTVMASVDTFWISALAILAAGIALFSIFQYKARLRQMKLGALNSLIMGGCLGMTYYYSTKGDQMLNPNTAGNFEIGFYIIAAALLFNSLANRFIRKDEKLVRSADRIR
ncbi:DUF4293 domain-containing protein [Marinoscillum sp. 108]|uniref:DUF4293 domain-containing protein n=1 Tax=Marinoscillum sp. 108 TaxID=2653151 RepID=UPI0012F1F5CD|nr:DUF4293 domain-containing protein [Marinoscillum sp. 108]VXD20806.1 conserved membrane hypothetical protein [Marinoscillum sp. 108]